ncbi:MAG: type IV-A pilus assembly ATPase PilB [bacterium]|nr:type IV-A pilus assembly ATPase PilB [bacterium]
MDSKKIIEWLITAGLIKEEVADKINRYSQTAGESIEEAIVKQGILSEEDLTKFLGKHINIPYVDISNLEIADRVIKLITYEFARKAMCIPIKKVGKNLQVAMADPTDIALIDDIKFITGCEVEPNIASRTQIQAAINRYYKGEDITEIMKDMKEEELEVIEEHEEEEADVASLQAAVEAAPVVRYVDSLIGGAIRKRASDIHIEPYERMVRVRTRVDGVLFEEPVPPFGLKDAIISRVKVMANLDLAERRIPQDGRIKRKFEEREVDFRVSTMPTIYGEKVVLRVLDKSALCVDLEKLGFEPKELDQFLRAIQCPYGLILVTGPTGSGKTTTLYSALSRINTPDTNILTVEDPVEYNFVGINQVQVRERIGLTFSSALRSFLRQDPDIIMVGEIRDKETASIAIRAALTGHLVLSTLHTNDAPSAISRLIDMEVEPFLVSSSLTLVVAQRLIRRICQRCKEPTTVPVEALKEVGLSPDEMKNITPYHGKGCSECNVGYRGREGVFEVMSVTPKIKELALARRPVSEITKVAIEEGMLTLREAALLKFKRGITTLEEVIRVTATI